MTDTLSAPSIGKRIQAIRRQRGFATAQDLADAIPDGRLSESVLQNIEAGRKSDLSVSQLLNISRALRVSPIFLLAPLGRPAAHVDLPNLSSDVAGMTVAEFDNWVSGVPYGPYKPRADELAERLQLDAARELRGLALEIRRLERVSTLSVVHTKEQQQAIDQFDTTEERLRGFRDRGGEIMEYLAGTDWLTE